MRTFLVSKTKSVCFFNVSVVAVNKENKIHTQFEIIC